MRTYNIPRDENMKLRDFPTLRACDSVRACSGNRARCRSVSASPAEAEEARRRGCSSGSASSAGPSNGASRRSRLSGCRSKRSVLAMVAEKTGYPQDMLDLDLDLEADLGVDTVKQAEMFAAIRESLQHSARREHEAT